jgi:hypothetical protein
MPTTTPRRPVAPRRATTARPTRTTRPSIPGRRKPAPPSRGGQLLGLVTKALPPAVASKRTVGKKGGSKGRNLALLGIAGGLAAAIKKRSAKKEEQEVAVASVPPVPPAPPVTPAV